MAPQPTEKICVLVVDDETPARQRLLDLLRREPFVGTLLEAGDGIAAVKAIEETRPDLVFLDVQMPELDGLGVMDTVGPELMPMTVFVTAYDQHAVRAFEANALDYLLKPFSDERYEATMERVRGRLDELSLQEFGRRLMRMISSNSTPDGLADPGRNRPGLNRLDRLVIKSGGATRFIRVTEIDWIEAAGVYVNLHLGSKELLYRAALTELAERLDPTRFIRVHRSTIVNIESILQLEPISHGEFDVVLKGGGRTRISRTYRSQLEERLGQSL